MQTAPALRPTPLPSNAPRRRPEHYAQACYRAFRLQGEVAAGRRASGGARARDRARTEAPFTGLPAALQTSLQAALGRALDDAARRALLDGLARARRLEGASDQGPVTDVLYVLRQSAFDAKDALRALGWLDRPVFSRLDRLDRRRFLAADLRFGARVDFRRLASSLMGCEGLCALPASIQIHLLAYAIGPTGATAERTEVLQAGWAPRRNALRSLLDASKFRRSSPTLQAEFLQDFLHEPAASVWLLQATALTGHAVVVVGDPADPRAISYGRRWVRTREGHPKAVSSSPDPSVRAGWKRPAIDRVTRYAADRFSFTRISELTFVNWLEATLGAVLSAQAFGPRPAAASVTRFVSSVEGALSQMAHAPSERLVVVGGRVHSDALQTEGTEGLLQAYLSA